LESRYIKIAQKSEIPVGKMKKFKIQSKEILVANVNGNFFAMDNLCTHEHGDLSLGTLDNNVVTCPKHKSKFDITTGKVVSPPKIAFFHPKIKDGTVYPLKFEKEDILINL
jgi:nitrite reductase/ring-hydroxylating ferredoxin subunit